MSLRDTLDAARREVQDGGTVFAGRGDEKSAKQDEANESRSRRARGSAARAKPARDAGSSVRVVAADSKGNKNRTSRPTKPRSEMTKEERQAERQAARRAEDKRVVARNALLNSYPEYQRSQRVWWILLGVGLGLTIVAFAINWAFSGVLSQQEGMTPVVVAAIGTIVAAYGCIIAAVIYDLRVGRPLRKRADAEMQGMTVKRMNALIREEEKREEEKKAKKEAKREARRLGR